MHPIMQADCHDYEHAMCDYLLWWDVAERHCVSDFLLGLECCVGRCYLLCSHLLARACTAVLT